MRLAIRAYRANPVVAAVAILSLALGIGATSAIFSIADSLLFRSLPVDRPERLALLMSTLSGPALLGLGMALWASRLLVRQLSTFTNSVFLDVQLDWRVLVFTAAVTLEGLRPPASRMGRTAATCAAVAQSAVRPVPPWLTGSCASINTNTRGGRPDL